MLPLLLLLVVSGSLAATLVNDGDTTIITDSYEDSNTEITLGPATDMAPGLIKSAYKVEETTISPPMANKPNSESTAPVAPRISGDTSLKQEAISSVATVSNIGDKVATAQQEFSTGQGHVVSASTSSMMVGETSTTQLSTQPPVSTQDEVASSGNVITTVTMKTMPTQGSLSSANINMATTIKPAPTPSYGISANISTATSIKPLSTQGYSSMATSTLKQGTTTPGLKITVAPIVATTTAPKKNDGSSSTTSILPSVVPIVVSVLLNWS